MESTFKRIGKEKYPNLRIFLDRFAEETGILPEKVGRGITSPILYKEGKYTYIFGKILAELGLPNFMNVYYYYKPGDITFFQNVYGTSLNQLINTLSETDYAAIIYQVIIIYDIMFRQAKLLHMDLHGPNILIVENNSIIPCSNEYETMYMPILIDYDEMQVTSNPVAAMQNLNNIINYLASDYVIFHKENTQIPEDFFEPLIQVYNEDLVYEEYYDSILEYLCSIMDR